MAVGLLGGASSWLAAGPLGRGADHGYARDRLLAARQALLAHATAYPELYGPAGAGPGHLICPDTDTPLASGGPLSSAAQGGGREGSAFRGDGPNPPCGNGSIAIGRLPRQVSLPGGRRSFHHEARQRFVYAVSTRYVNNPSGRVVNPASGGHAGGAVSRDENHDESGDTDRNVGRESPPPTIDEAVAIVIDPGGVDVPGAELVGAIGPRELLERVRDVVRREAGSRAADTLPYAVLGRDVLLDAAARRVAAWFVDAATAVAARRCENARRSDASATSTGNAVGAPVGARPVACRTRWPAVRCGDADAVLSWLDERPEEGPGESVREGVENGSGGELQEGTGGCGATDEASTLSVGSSLDAIENTPRERHWFVRNDWPRFVDIERDADCRAEAADRCRLQLAGHDGERLSIRLVSAGAAPVPAPPSSEGQP